MSSLQKLGSVDIFFPFTGLAVFPIEPAPVPRPKDLEQLRGDWALVKLIHRSGTVSHYKVVLPTGSLDENLTFDGPKVTTEFTYCDPTDTLVESVKVDSTRIPKWIDLTALDSSFPIGELKGRTRCGVYRIDGDILRLSIGRYDEKRPSSLEPGKDYDVYEYKRIER